MDVIENVSLAKYATLKIGGVCKKLLFPKTESEIIDILRTYPNAPLLGGGSNLLINDQHAFDAVICMRKFMADVIEINDDLIFVGAGVRLQKFIKYINENSYGGIEYLWSVPGLVGGAIYMNAGRGRGANKQISDYLVSVEVLEDGQVKTYTKDECEFGYRTSVFQKKNCIILSAIFSFDRISPEEGKRLQMARVRLCKQFQDNKYPNAGTTFCESDPRIMNIIQKISSKKATKGVHFSFKTSNWLQNRGEGTYNEAVKLINRVKFLHKILGKPCKLEYKVWE